MDGTDCPIREPSLLIQHGTQHKFKGPGVRYEIGISIHSGNVVWSTGPYPCGSYPDNVIFQRELKTHLAEDELVITDVGYKDFQCLMSHVTPIHQNLIFLYMEIAFIPFLMSFTCKWPLKNPCSLFSRLIYRSPNIKGCYSKLKWF